MFDQLYRLYDIKTDALSFGAIPIEPDEATYWNERNFGIFWSVNSFRTEERKTDNLKKINAWVVDLDKGSKEEQIKIIKQGLKPSLINETKNGFHLYFYAKDATLEGYKSIHQDRLIPFYSSDPKVIDIPRLLRVPGFMHCKDPNNKFLIKTIYSPEIFYSEKEICSFYKPSSASILKEQKKAKFAAQLKTHFNIGDDVFTRLWNMDCEYALTKLSGHHSVGSQQISFYRTASGNLNILVDGVGTSCWIDKDKRIGSFDKGGPTIFQWINWYQKNPSLTMKYIREVFPELWQSTSHQSFTKNSQVFQTHLQSMMK